MLNVISVDRSDNPISYHYSVPNGFSIVLIITKILHLSCNVSSPPWFDTRTNAPKLRMSLNLTNGAGGLGSSKRIIHAMLTLHTFADNVQHLGSFRCRSQVLETLGRDQDVILNSCTFNVHVPVQHILVND